MNTIVGDHSILRPAVLRASVAIFSAIICVGKLQADPIALDNNSIGGQSILDAEVRFSPGYQADVNSLPYNAPISASSAFQSASLTDNLTTSGFSFGYSAAIGQQFGPDGGGGSGGSIFFQAGAGTTYSIVGSLVETGDFSYTEGGLGVLLFDLTQSQTVYSYSESVSAGSLNLDSSWGPLSGLLTSGDVYRFYADVGLRSVQSADSSSLVGNVGITFTQSVPEPSTYALLLAGMALLAFYRCRRLVFQGAR
jgi:hypothetical protein